MTAQHQHLARRILDWLRAGYPEGIPATDRVALMGLLHRSLDDAEVQHIADQLASTEQDDLVSNEDIAEAIRAYAHEKPSETDVARVADKLVAGGFGLARSQAAQA